MQNVKHFCKLKGIKPTVACAESGVSTSFLTNINKGSSPTVDNVQKLSTYLGVTTSQLLGEPEPDKKEKDPDSISAAEAARDEALINFLTQLSPEEFSRVDAFVQGMIASR